ncbi:hypothetical protein GCM10009862_28930 [Microbacterium binotii]|uniref:ABC3 transporter permease C-terminal domain-containing protein n=1 Tax=Microbacterium binotii TaxID=462710 RepID=A0ABP6BUV2_9MICO
MSFSSLLNALLLLVLVVWLGYRQSTWRPIRSGRMWRMPILLGIAGVAVLAQTVDRITALDVIALTVEAAISLGVGAAMGWIARIRPVAQPSARRAGASLESRTGWWGMALWLVLNAFAVIALLAASFGIVNTLLMSVHERTREIGLMKAMGMSSGRVFTLFSIEAAFIGFLGSAIGAGIGMIAGTAISGALSRGLFADLAGLQLIAFDPLSIVTIILVVMAIAFLAGTLPAARAARADPVTSLRYE